MQKNRLPPLIRLFAKVALTYAALICCLYIPAFAQNTAKQTIKGKVVDEKGLPVASVTIQEKGNSLNGTQTTNDGSFSINVPPNAILVASSVSYTTREIPAKNGMVIAVEMQDKSLEDVVVVGYGSQKKVNLSGSVGTVSAKHIADRPVSSLTNSLQGLVPGMTVLARPGDVGGDIAGINVRGRGNLGVSSPLFVVDGIPVEAGIFARLNSSDIASVSVLKDAAASSIYGSRAAYGVILVTTKKGTTGKAQVQFSSNYGIQSATVLPAMLDAYNYALLRNEAATNVVGANPVYSATKLDTIRRQLDPDHYPNTDWIGEAFLKTAPLMENQLSVSGGNEKTKYYISGAYMRQGSLKEGKNLDRYSLISNIDSRLSDKFKVATSISYIRDQYKATGGDFGISQLVRMTPLVVNKHSDGTWGSMTSGAVDVNLLKDNPIRISQIGGRRNYYQNRFLGTVIGTLTPIKGLDIDGTLSYRTYNYANSVFANTMPSLINFNTKLPLSGSATSPNSLEETWQNTGTLLAQLTAAYEKRVDKHYGKLLVGTSYENFREDNLKLTRKQFANNNMGAIDGGSADPNNNVSEGTKYTKAFESFFGRFNYSYKDRYLFEANLRIDASSQFAADNRWGSFPSFSAAWRVSEEDFMKDISWLQQLKLRGSWGILGNVNNVGYYDFYDGLKSGVAAILDQQKVDGVWPFKVANPALTWEKKQMTNIGIDGTVFNSLNFQIDAYHSVTSNILLPDPNVPDEAGLTFDSDPKRNQMPSRNLGKVQNNGVELSLSYSGKVGKDFQYSVGGNMSKVWNKVLELDGVSDSYITGDYYIMKKGEAIGAFYMWKADGLFATDADVAAHAKQGAATKAGDIRYVDMDNSKTINGDDRTVVGNDVPYFNYGLNLNASYKNFDFSLIGQGVGGVSVYLANEASQPFFNKAGVREFHLHRWTKENPDPNADFPRMLISSANTHNLAQSSFWLFNANYFRIKSISIGYNVSDKLMHSIGMQRARVYVATNNMFTIRGDKRLKDFDPEAPSSRATYPQLKTFSFGLNLTF